MHTLTQTLTNMYAPRIIVAVLGAEPLNTKSEVIHQYRMPTHHRLLDSLSLTLCQQLQPRLARFKHPILELRTQYQGLYLSTAIIIKTLAKCYTMEGF